MLAMITTTSSKLSGDTFSIEAPPNLPKNKKNIRQEISSGKRFGPFKVATNFLEHSSGAFIEVSGVTIHA